MRKQRLTLAAFGAISTISVLAGGFAGATPAPADDTTVQVVPELSNSTQVPPTVRLVGFNCRIGVQGQTAPTDFIDLEVQYPDDGDWQPIGHGYVDKNGMIRNWKQLAVAPDPGTYIVARVRSMDTDGTLVTIAAATFTNSGRC